MQSPLPNTVRGKEGPFEVDTDIRDPKDLGSSKAVENVDLPVALGGGETAPSILKTWQRGDRRARADASYIPWGKYSDPWQYV